MDGANRRIPTAVQWMACATVIVAFSFLCLDGYHVGLSPSYNGSSQFFGEPPNINWTHGWPFHCAVRSSIYPASVGPGLPNPASFTGDIGYYSRWPFDNAPVAILHMTPLVADLLILGLLLIGTWYWLHRITNLSFRFQFGTRWLFASTLIVAIAIVLRLPSMLPRQAMQFVALFIMLCASGAAGHALILLIVTRLRRPT